MEPETLTLKCCDPQHFDLPPDQGWDLESLGAYAQAQYEAIDDSECALAVRYWRLGAALSFARRQFGRGQWSKYLEELGIERTRASKARAIFRTFSTEELLHGVSVDAAYRQRKRQKPTGSNRKRSQKSQSNNSASPGIDEFLRDVVEKLVGYQEVAQTISPESAQQLLPAIGAAVSELSRLHGLLNARCSRPP